MLQETFVENLLGEQRIEKRGERRDQRGEIKDKELIRLEREAP